MCRGNGVVDIRSNPGFWPALVVMMIGLAGCGGGSSRAGTGPSPSPTVTPLPGPTPTPSPFADHVVVVMLENHSAAQVLGSPFMPFFNALAAQFAVAGNYFANSHPSIGNYFMLTVGQLETTDDHFAGTVADDNIVRALTGASKSWKAYMESLPAQGYTGNDVIPYVRHHNPFAFLTDVLSSSEQRNQIVPFSQFAADLALATLPNFAFVVPNLENDAHDCPGEAPTCADTDKLAAADNWLVVNISPLISSPAFANGVLIITFDEGVIGDLENGGGQVATVLVGAHVKKGFRSVTFYQHQSTLRLVLDLLGVNDRPGQSANAPSMFEFFQ